MLLRHYVKGRIKLTFPLKVKNFNSRLMLHSSAISPDSELEIGYIQQKYTAVIECNIYIRLEASKGIQYNIYNQDHI